MSSAFAGNVPDGEIVKTDLSKLPESNMAAQPAPAIRPRTREYVHTWAENSSCNGIPSIARSRHPFRTILWLLIFFTALGLVLWQVSTSFIKYLTYPVGVGVNITSVTALRFPAVTFCNVNQVRKSVVGGHLPNAEAILPLSFGGNKIYKMDSTDRFETRERFDNSWAVVDPAIQQAAGHQKEDMILDCSFGNLRCSPKDFHLTLNPVHGNCFTFNSGWHGNKPRISHKPGAMYGLTLEILLEEEEYIPEITENAGLKLLVHAQEHMPFPQDMGIFLQPGQMTSVAVTLVNITRQPFPYPSNCYILKGDAVRKHNVFADKYNVSYSHAACQKSCYQSWVIGNCSCGDPTLPMSGSAVMSRAADKQAVIKPCLTEEEEECEEATKRLYIDGQLQCDCQLECVDQEETVTIETVSDQAIEGKSGADDNGTTTEFTTNLVDPQFQTCPLKCDLNYRMTPSQSVWPNSLFADSYYNYMKEKHPSVKRLVDSMGISSLRKNLIKIHVFFTELAYESVEEIPSYTFESLIADLGGTMGFYLGVSVVAFCEFFELLLDLLRLCLVKLSSESGGSSKVKNIKY